MKLSDEGLLAAAREAQYKVIKHWMIERYIGNRAKIGNWDDFQFSLCFFTAHQVDAPLTGGQIRHRLRRLPEITENTKRYGRYVHFQFSREVCDAFAASAKEYWESQGLSGQEIRSYNK